LVDHANRAEVASFKLEVGLISFEVAPLTFYRSLSVNRPLHFQLKLGPTLGFLKYIFAKKLAKKIVVSDSKQS
jgi:hypothetical protein